MAANVGRLIKGSNGRIDFGGGFYGNLAKYKVDPKGQKLVQTSFESAIDPNTGGVFQDGDVAITECTVTLSGYWDKNNNPYAATPNLVFGAYLSTVKIFVDKTSGTRCFTFTSLQVMEAATDGDIAGRVEFSCTLEARGLWTYPI